MIIGQLAIKKIALQKVVVYSSSDKLQRNIDLNNIVTTNKLNEQTVYLYGHYTQIKNLVLNRIYELKKKDLITITTETNTLEYQITAWGIIKKQEIKKLEGLDKSVIILTCTKDFKKDYYYYFKAIKRGQ